MGSSSLAGMLEMTDIDTVLSWHLSHNHYPPVPLSMIGACKRAIAACRDGKFGKSILLPRGVRWRGKRFASASAIVEGHHLEMFLAEGDNE